MNPNSYAASVPISPPHHVEFHGHVARPLRPAVEQIKQFILHAEKDPQRPYLTIFEGIDDDAFAEFRALSFDALLTSTPTGFVRYMHYPSVAQLEIKFGDYGSEACKRFLLNAFTAATTGCYTPGRLNVSFWDCAVDMYTLRGGEGEGAPDGFLFVETATAAPEGLLLVEIAHVDTLLRACRKLRTLWDGHPSVQGAVIFCLDETPEFRTPAIAADAPRPSKDWEKTTNRVHKQTEWGPVYSDEEDGVEELMWFGEATLSVSVYLQPSQLEYMNGAYPAQGTIIPDMVGLGPVDDALDEIFQRIRPRLQQLQHQALVPSPHFGRSLMLRGGYTDWAQMLTAKTDCLRIDWGQLRRECDTTLESLSRWCRWKCMDQVPVKPRPAVAVPEPVVYAMFPSRSDDANSSNTFEEAAAREKTASTSQQRIELSELATHLSQPTLQMMAKRGIKPGLLKKMLAPPATWTKELVEHGGKRKADK